MLAEIASFVPIPPNIDIVVRLLLLFQMVTSKNEINVCYVYSAGRYRLRLFL